MSTFSNLEVLSKFVLSIVKVTMKKGGKNRRVQCTQAERNVTDTNDERPLAALNGSCHCTPALADEQLSLLVKSVVTQILQQPSFLEMITTVVTKKVVESLQNTIDFNGEKLSELETQLKICKAENVTLKKDLEEKLDELEQYQRRNNIRIYGLEERAGENTDQLVLKVAADIGADISLSDIDRSHRLGAPRMSTGNRKPRPIICKLVSYAKRREIFTKKRQLRGTGITIREDLTSAKLQLLSAVSNKYGIKNVWSIDGTIIANIQGVKKRMFNVRDLN